MLMGSPNLHIKNFIQEKHPKTKDEAMIAEGQSAYL